MLRAILRFLSGEDRFVTIEQLYEAISSASFTQVQSIQEKGLHLTSDLCSLFYKETRRADKKHVETLDMCVRAHRGGVIVTFIDDEIIALTCNAIERDVQRINEEEKRLLWQIILKTRHAIYS